MSLTLVEHKSASYGPRTFHNARAADLTVAIAINFTTGGEKLTKEAAKGSYLALHFRWDIIKNARLLYREMRDRNVEVLNVAGNGISTFSKFEIRQSTVNLYVYALLQQVHKYHPIKKIVSGGQTGVDIAGGIAGFKLGIPVEMTFPKGFRQRHEGGYDSDHTEDEIRHQVIDGSIHLPDM